MTATTSPATTSPATTSPATTSAVTTSPATTSPVTTSPVTTSPVTTSIAVDAFLAEVLRGSMSPVHYARRAVLDAVVPGWRFTAEGPDAIAQEYGRWFRHPGRLEDLRRLPTPTGEIVEYTLTWTEDGVAHTGRHVHVIDLDDTGRIASDHVWCGGRWPADLLAQMEQARHAR